MPTTDLTTTTRDAGHDLAPLESAVLAVLAGAPVPAAAAAAQITAAVLTDAVHDYRAAGRTALQDRARDGRWHQVNITFTDWAQAEDIASTALAPQLREAQTRRLVSGWWYVRKAPSWRLRLHPGPATTATALQQFTADLLTDLTARQLITDWSPGRYQPESWIFGGAMDITHQLFHADSSHILNYLHRSRQMAPATLLERRELSILLCSALIRTAGQEWHEHGDVWFRVTRMRPAPSGDALSQIPALSQRIRRLLLLDTAAAQVIGPAGPLAFADSWFTTMTDAGQALADVARSGLLRRGLRDVLAHQILFHWNRLGLPATTQTVLAHSAMHAVGGLE